ERGWSELGSRTSGIRPHPPHPLGFSPSPPQAGGEGKKVFSAQSAAAADRTAVPSIRSDGAVGPGQLGQPVEDRCCRLADCYRRTAVGDEIANATDAARVQPDRRQAHFAKLPTDKPALGNDALPYGVVIKARCGRCLENEVREIVED